MRDELARLRPDLAVTAGRFYLIANHTPVFETAEGNALMAKASLLSGNTEEYERFRKEAVKCADCSDEMKRELLNMKVAWTNVTSSLRWLPKWLRIKLAQLALRRDYQLRR